MLAAACNLVIDLLLIKKAGIYAASLSTMLSYLFLIVYRMADVRKMQNIYYILIKLMISNKLNRTEKA